MASGPLVPDGLAAEKFEILCAVFQRARAQRHALEGDDLETFLAILDERDELLGQLQQLVDAMPELPDNVVAFPNELNERTRHDDVLALDTVIRGIVSHDEHNEALLNERLESLAGEVPARRPPTGYHESSGATWIACPDDDREGEDAAHAGAVWPVVP